jgi:hypothetical protein
VRGGQPTCKGAALTRGPLSAISETDVPFRGS